jgi:hypothetical protein
MGLNVSHGAFRGAYSAFNRLRQVIVEGPMGGHWPGPGQWLDGTGAWTHEEDLGYSRETHPGLWEFLCHSDCDGEIEPEMCALVARDLEPLLPAMEALGMGVGHIERDGGYRAVLQRFIDGCRRAAEAGEPLLFE